MPDYREPAEEPIEGTAERIEQPQPQAQAQLMHRAADGGVIPGPSHGAGSFLDMLEDGQLSYEVHEQLKELASNIAAVANTTGAKTKGELTLTLKIEKQGREDALHISGAVKVKSPDLPRRRSIVWQDDGGSFTRFPPNQTQMFGTAQVRRVG
jgi:hypothetical protein